MTIVTDELFSRPERARSSRVAPRPCRVCERIALMQSAIAVRLCPECLGDLDATIAHVDSVVRSSRSHLERIVVTFEAILYAVSPDAQDRYARIIRARGAAPNDPKIVRRIAITRQQIPDVDRIMEAEAERDAALDSWEIEWARVNAWAMAARAEIARASDAQDRMAESVHGAGLGT